MTRSSFASAVTEAGGVAATESNAFHKQPFAPTDGRCAFIVQASRSCRLVLLSVNWSAQREQEIRFDLAFCTIISRSSSRKQRMIRSLVPSAHLAVFKASVQFSSQSRSFQSAEIGCVVARARLGAKKRGRKASLVEAVDWHLCLRGFAAILNRPHR